MEKIPVTRWADAHGIPRPTAKRWAQKNDIPGVEQRQESRGPVWYVPPDAEPPTLRRGRPPA